MSSGRALTLSVIGRGMILVPLLAACSSTSSSESEAVAVARKFAKATAAEDVAAMCGVSAVGDRPAMVDSGSASLCEEVLAPLILESSIEVEAALDDGADPNVIVDGSEATAQLDGVNTAFTMVEVEGEWFVVVG